MILIGSSMEKERLFFIDYAKAIGIFLVVFAHCAQKFSESVSHLGPFIYSFHMPLFFVISGFLLCLKNPSIESIGKIAKRLLIPYFIWSFVYLSAYLIRGFEFDVVVERLLAIITGRGVAPLWFLWDLFFSELIFVLLLAFWKTFGKIKFLCAMVALALATFLLSDFYELSQDILEENTFVMYCFISMARLFPSVFFLIVGALFVRVNKTLSCNKKTCFLLGLASFIVLFFIQKYTGNRVNMHLFYFENPLIFLVTGSLGSIAVLCLCKMFYPNIRVLAFLGRKSLDVMVLHYPPVPLMLCTGLTIGMVISKDNIFFVSLVTLALLVETCLVGALLGKIKKILKLACCKRLEHSVRVENRD